MDRRLIVYLLLIVAVPSFAQYTDYGFIRLYSSGKMKGDSLLLQGRTMGGELNAYPYRDSYGSSFGISMISTGSAYYYAGLGFIDSVSGKSWTFGYRTGNVNTSEKRELRLDYFNGLVYVNHAKWDSIGGYTVLSSLTVTSGYDDTDSSRTNGSTWRTTVPYHTGLSGSTFGNLLTGTINTNGNSVTGGAASFSTGTFSSTITQNGNATGNVIVNNSTGSPLTLNVYSNTATTGPSVQFNSAAGTSNSSYSAISSGKVMGAIFASGAYSAAAFSGSTAAIRFRAAENYSATNQGTYIDMATTAIGATSRTVDFVLRKNNALPELTLGTTAGTGTGNLFIDSLYLNTTLFVTATGRLAYIGGISSVGAFGVAPIVDTVTYTGMSSGFSKNLTSTAGFYKLSYSIFCTTADAAAGSVQLTLSFNNGAAQTMTSAAVNLTSTASKDDDAFMFYVASGTPTVSTAITGSAGTSKHSVHAIVERLK